MAAAGAASEGAYSLGTVMLYFCNALRHALRVVSMTDLGFDVRQEDYGTSRGDGMRRCNYELSRVMGMRRWPTVLNATGIECLSLFVFEFVQFGLSLFYSGKNFVVTLKVFRVSCVRA